MPVACFDVDSVLTDYLKGFHGFMVTKGYNPIKHPCGSQLLNWSMECTYPQLNDDKIIESIIEYSQSDLYKNMEFIPGAKEAVNNLIYKNPNWDFIALTAAGTDPDVIKTRKEMIKDFPFSEVIVIGERDPKLQHYKDLKVDLVVEDHVKNGLAALEVGAALAIFDYPYNRGIKSHVRFNNWDDGQVQIQNILDGNIPNLKSA